MGIPRWPPDFVDTVRKMSLNAAVAANKVPEKFLRLGKFQRRAGGAPQGEGISRRGADYRVSLPEFPAGVMETARGAAKIYLEQIDLQDLCQSSKIAGAQFAQAGRFEDVALSFKQNLLDKGSLVLFDG